mgnify:CR=1 FL=1
MMKGNFQSRPKSREPSVRNSFAHLLSRAGRRSAIRPASNLRHDARHAVLGFWSFRSRLRRAPLPAARHTPFQSLRPGGESTYWARTVCMGRAVHYGIYRAMSFTASLMSVGALRSIKLPRVIIPRRPPKWLTIKPRTKNLAIFLLIFNIILTTGCNGFKFNSGMFDLEINNHDHASQPGHDSNSTR